MTVRSADPAISGMTLISSPLHSRGDIFTYAYRRQGKCYLVQCKRFREVWFRRRGQAVMLRRERWSNPREITEQEYLKLISQQQEEEAGP